MVSVVSCGIRSMDGREDQRGEGAAINLNN